MHLLLFWLVFSFVFFIKKKTIPVQVGPLLIFSFFFIKYSIFKKKYDKLIKKFISIHVGVFKTEPTQ